MKVQYKSAQRGISFMGLLFVAGTLGIAGVIAAQVFPTVVEYQAITRAAARASQAPSGTMAEVRLLFDKQAAVDDIRTISGKDVEVTKEGDKIVVKFAYQREIHLTGPAWLTLKYEGRSK
jgi:hypothetical protein